MIKYFYILLFVFTLSGCTSSDDKFLKDDIVVIDDNKVKDGQINQNRWIYTQMKRQYYWNSDIPDSLSLNYEQTSPRFFNNIKSAKDRFSWIETNNSYQGESLYDRFGLDYQEYILPDGNKVNRIILVDNNSSAKDAGLRRGMWFMFTKNIESESSLTLKVGNISNNDTFISTESVVVTKTSTKATTHTSAILIDSIYNISGHKIGYFVYNQFQDTSGNVSNIYRRELREMFQRFKDDHIDNLIIDIRYNPGGYVSMCQYLCSLILPDRYLGQISGYHEFNEYLSLEHYSKTSNREEILFFPSKDDVLQKNIGIGKIYTIITKRSFSASESLINTLEPCVNVKKVGTKSGGKGVGSWTIKDNNYSYQLQPITFRYYNSRHITVPDDGLTPDIFIDEATAVTLYELGDIRELLLATTLNDIVGSTKSKSIDTVPLITIRPVDALSFERRNVSGYLME